MAMVTRLLAFVLSPLLVPLHARAQQPLPIIDMHLHAYPADANGPPPLGLCIPLCNGLAPTLATGLAADPPPVGRRRT
jgi:hypothetical protein